MCLPTNRVPALECTIDDLPAGTQYHDPNGETWLVANVSRGADDQQHSTTVVNIRTGTITPVYSNTKMGRDERGRLYTSTALNDWYYDAPAFDDNTDRAMVAS